MKIKKNIETFNNDVQENGSYIYNNGSLADKLTKQRVLDVINNIYNFENKKILEIGCGDGRFTVQLSHYVKDGHILATEPSENAIKSAKLMQEKLNIKNITFDVKNIYDFSSDEKFDCVLFKGVLHHLPDPEKAIHIASKYADTIVIVEPNGYSPLLKVIEKASKYHREHEEQSFFLFTINKCEKVKFGLPPAVKHCLFGGSAKGGLSHCKRPSIAR